MYHGIYEVDRILNVQMFVSMSPVYIGTVGRGDVAALVSHSIHVSALQK
jgi:hypothetical protein